MPNEQNTPADRRRNPDDYQQLTVGEGALIVMLRNDLDREAAIRHLRAAADLLERRLEMEATA